MDTTKLSDYDRGVIAGMKRYAHWKDGVQYVGTCGNTLEAAIALYIRDDAEGVEDEEPEDGTLFCCECGESCEITKVNYPFRPYNESSFVSSCCQEDIKDANGEFEGWTRLSRRYYEQLRQRQEDSCG